MSSSSSLPRSRCGQRWRCCREHWRYGVTFNNNGRGTAPAAQTGLWSNESKVTAPAAMTDGAYYSVTGEALLAADTNGDGEITIADATHLQMYLAEYDVVLGKQFA